MNSVIMSLGSLTKVYGLRLSGYPTETVISRFHFSVPIFQILTQMEVSNFVVNKMCVGNGDATSRFLIQRREIITVSISPHLL